MSKKDVNTASQTQEIEPEDLGEDTPEFREPFNPDSIDIETQNINIGSLLEKIEYDELNFNTDFQRFAGLWSEEKQSRLIESLLLGLPLPAFYFDASNSSKWDIIDGLQRCTVLKKFCIDRKMRLKGLEFLSEKLEGKNFDELGRPLQRNITGRTIIVNKLKKGDRRVRFIIFKRLNTGGLELTPQEIRNAVYQGDAITLINKLATDEIFLKVTEGKIPSNRMQDRDFISRFVAFYTQSYKDYQPSLDEFVNVSIEQLEERDKDYYHNLERCFKLALALAYDIWGDQSFRKPSQPGSPRKPINKAYFEVITSTLAQVKEKHHSYLKARAGVILEKTEELMTTSYPDKLSVATGTKASVEYRHSKFRELICQVIPEIDYL